MKVNICTDWNIVCPDWNIFLVYLAAVIATPQCSKP